MLQSMPPLEDCSENEILARGRLATTVGYGYRWGGLLQQAEQYNIQAIAALRKLDTHKDELAIALNNQAYVYGRQGQVVMARIRGGEALEINEEIDSTYSTGLTLTNLATIERIAGDLDKALKYSVKGKDLFHRLEDTHGVIRTYDNIGDATRRVAKQMIEEGRDLIEARQKLDEATETYTRAIEEAVQNGFDSELSELRTNFGKVKREQGRLLLLTEEGMEKAQVFFQKSLDDLQKALEAVVDPISKADILQDIAWLRFLWGNIEDAEAHLDKIEAMVGETYLLKPGMDPEEKTLPTQYYWPLGKAERLRGEIYITTGRYFEGLKRFLFAYAYFSRFSEDAVEKNMLIDTVYKRIKKLPDGEQRRLLEDLRKWSADNGGCIGGVNLSTFLKLLTNLLGF
jgi:tetratricopeptide (TPR) repeat protein